MLRGMRRSSLFTSCVVTARRIRTKDITGESVVTESVPPVKPAVGAEVITGCVAREPSGFKRYGGVKISASA